MNHKQMGSIIFEATETLFLNRKENEWKRILLNRELSGIHFFLNVCF